jgi:signal transduction histidine kinase
MMNSPTIRLVAGLAFTLAVIGGYAAYTLQAVAQMREVQVSIVDRNRLASLQLIRIQNDLNSLGLAMRDMLDDSEQYPLTAWRAPMERMKQNLGDALAKEAEFASTSRPAEQSAFLKASFAEFWRACDVALEVATKGDQAKALDIVRHTLQPRQEALSALAARLLVGNNEQESLAAEKVRAIYSQIERNAYLFLGCAIALIVLNSVMLIRSNRKLFTQLSELAEQRSELAQQLISTQESTFRAISRDLHDEFGQILTALGAMLRRARGHAPDDKFRQQVQEASEVVQMTLEKIRSLSQSLQPVILEERGLVAAVEWHVSVFERHTGIAVSYEPPQGTVDVEAGKAIHVFRILQEALNNVARHAGVDKVSVKFEVEGQQLRLAVEDRGRGIRKGAPAGVGLAAMRERAELIGGHLKVAQVEGGGTKVEVRMETSRG